MSYEKIKQPIVAENILEHGRELDFRLLEIQLHFVEEEIKKGEFKNYVNLLSGVTQVISQIAYRRFWYMNSQGEPKLTESERISKEEEYAREIETEIKSISDATEGEEREKKVYTYITNALNVYPKVNESNDGDAGLIRVNTDKVWDDLKYGDLREGDDLLQIHFTPAFTKGEKISSREIKKWFSDIAIMIIEKHPKTRAVVGTSWLMSHPVMKRFGFEIVSSGDSVLLAGGSYWDQLIDQNGQIDVDRLRYLEENGELPYKVTSGYMKVEDFLKKYLPAEKRGDIVLEKVNEEIRAKMDLIKKEVDVELKGKWKEIIESQQRVDDIFERMPNFVGIARSIGVEPELRSLLQELISKKLGLEELRGNKEMVERFGPTMEKIEEKIKSDLKYIKYHLSI